MRLRYREVEAQPEPAGRRIRLRFRLERSGGALPKLLGWQIYDPLSATFLQEGEWTPLDSDQADLQVELPEENGPYRLYVSPIGEGNQWLYTRGAPFVIVDATVRDGTMEVAPARVTTLGALRRESFFRSLPKAFTLPVRTVWQNRKLIASMVRRDILARYRGSFGDALWTFLNPLLLMVTYFFVFGVVLRTRFGADTSRSGYVLYFLAGMLPWLAFSEAVGRAPTIILEYRNFVKKLVFPIETLPVNLVVAGMVTEVFALLIFFVFLLLARGSVPPSVAWLPLLVVPQLLLTVGLAWFFAGLGVFVRDLGQVIGFLLTLWFFLTPICYPEAGLPQEALFVLDKNPMFVLVRGYRAIFLEHHAPEFMPLAVLWVASIAAAILGHAWFYKLRKSFADVI